MPQVQYTARNIDPRALFQFCRRLFAAAGLRQQDADLVTDSLVAADLRGVASHGVARIPHYLERIRLGGVKAQPEITTAILSPTLARVDGDHGLGQLVMDRAAGVAVELARQTGAGWVAVVNSSHCGALAYYGLKIADSGMVGLVFTHVDPMVVPYGARAAFCGTNPLCITAPRASHGSQDLATGAVCLDMATSKAPWNAVANAAREGVSIPDGWAVDAAGEETTDPRRVAAMMPAGEYKGSGLGIMIDILCAMLGGAPFGPDIPKMYGDDLSQHRRLGGLVGAIDIGRFVPLAQFHARMVEMTTRLGAISPRESSGTVLFPGEPELLARQRHLREGIPLGLQTIEALNRAAGQFGLDLLNEAIPTSMQGPHARSAVVQVHSAAQAR
jgi:ureidoglycolate dehydrogenase (NAD+)